MTANHSPAADSTEIDSFDFEFIEGGVDPKTLKIHKNVRIDPRVEADREFLDSIRRRGVRTAIAAYRDAQGDLVVLRGQRRTLGAVLVGRDRVPVMVEPEPTEAERIADQVVENDQRAGLVASEHVAAYEELALIGLTAEQIADMAGTSAPRVKAALTVTKLGAVARAVVSSVPDVDLLQVAVLEEFEDDAAAVAKLTECLENGSGFDHQVQRLRDERALAEEVAKLTAQLQQEGYTVLESSPGTEGKARPLTYLKKGTRDLTSGLHKKCPGRAVTISRSWDGDRNVRVAARGSEYCLDYALHGHELQTWAARSAGLDGKTPEQKAQESAAVREAKKYNPLMRSATKLRVRHLEGLTQLKKAPDGFGLMIAFALTADQNIVTWTQQRNSKFAHKLFGLEAKDYNLAEGFKTLADGAGKARGEVLAACLILAAYEDHFDVSSWRTREAWVKRYLEFLESTGYELSDVEKIAAGRLTIKEYEKAEAAATASVQETVA